MTIRPATVKDYKNLMTLYNQFVGEDRYSKLDNDSFKEVLKESDSYIFVAEDRGKLVGFISFSVRKVIRYPKPIAEGEELYVQSNYRGKGLGKKLMQTIIDKATSLNCYRMYLETAYKWTTAHKMYWSLGFKNNGYHFYKNL